MVLMANSNTNQQNNHGGKRAGAGRPKGSKTKLKLADFMSPDEIDMLVDKWKELTILAENPDRQLFLELIHQNFGKATQKLAGDGDEDPLQLIQILRGASNDTTTTKGS